MAKGKIESVKERLQGLIDLSNEVTEGEHTDLTSAVTDLAEKAKKGGSASFADNEAGGMTYTVKAGEVTGEGDETLKANKFVLNGEAKIDLTNDTVLEEDVRKGKTFHKADGSQGVGTGGGAELNIAYGDTAPEDTSKLWVKTSEPSGVIVSSTAISSEGDGASGEVTDILMPDTHRYDVATCLVGDKMYYLGGERKPQNNLEPVSANYVFDFEHPAFSESSISFNRTQCGYAVVGRKIYLMGGYTPNNTMNPGTRVKTIQVYDVDSGDLATSDITLDYTVA